MWEEATGFVCISEQLSTSTVSKRVKLQIVENNIQQVFHTKDVRVDLF